MLMDPGPCKTYVHPPHTLHRDPAHWSFCSCGLVAMGTKVMVLHNGLKALADDKVPNTMAAAGPEAVVENSFTRSAVAAPAQFS